MVTLPFLLLFGAFAAALAAGRSAPARGTVSGRARPYPPYPPYPHAPHPPWDPWRPEYSRAPGGHVPQGRGAYASPPRAPRAPSALDLLVALARQGRTPPPILVSAAIAEAQRLGQGDLLRAIVDTYVRPVVQQASYAPGPAYEPAPDDANYPGNYQGAYPENYQAPAPPAGVPAQDAESSVQDLASDPGAWDPASHFAPPAPISDDDVLRMVDPRTPSPPSQNPPGLPEDPGPSGGNGNAGTITVSGRSSPIEGVGGTEWSRFCDRMARELPTYTSVHHVGQFRQRRGRLLELGIDPETVLASPDHQQGAFDHEMTDALARAHGAGLLGYVGHPVEVPVPDGPAQTAHVTTSGVLAVVQAAGVDGAASWFRSPADRRRFAGTTQVFSRANGVF